MSDHIYGFAVHASQASKDLSTRVGAVLVTDSGQVLAAACNELPPNVRDLPDRRERPAKYLFTAHAEERLISVAALMGVSTKGCTVYTTHYPCAGCARMIIMAGVRRVVVGPGKTSMPAEQFEAAKIMFKEAGVAVAELE